MQLVNPFLAGHRLKLVASLPQRASGPKENVQ